VRMDAYPSARKVFIHSWSDEADGAMV